MPTDIKITTTMLFLGALIFAGMDAVYIPLLMWRVSTEKFQKMKWSLAIAAGLVWFGIWYWAIGNFWETVYRYVFPAWTQRWIPSMAGAAAAPVGFALWKLAMQAKGKSVLMFCLSGGLLGALSHTWAVVQGIVTKPPMLQGASPLGAVTIAFFEYIFYWCTILVMANGIVWAWEHARKPS